MKLIRLLLLMVFSSLFLIAGGAYKQAYAQACCPCVSCFIPIGQCGVLSCACRDIVNTGETIEYEDLNYVMHREWLIRNLWEAHVLPAMMLMAHQITTITMQQTMIIGTLFDAKHQLESQRILNDLQASAHKEFQVSEGMCRYGTNSRSLAFADRNAEFTQMALSARATQRTMLAVGSIGTGGARDDERSRMRQFTERYCSAADLGSNLDTICENGDAATMNKDINFTHNVANPYTLDIDFSDSEVTDEEEDVLALGAYLYGHNLINVLKEDFLANAEGVVSVPGANAYMATRALAAKRSVAQNSYAAYVGQKALGGEAVSFFTTEILENMGIPEEIVADMVRESPSYNMQMELLTRKLYQNPDFFADLYDKPANIDRKYVSMLAISLMQKRDMYESQLRAEANSAIFLETYVDDLQSYYNNQSSAYTERSEILTNVGDNL